MTSQASTNTIIAPHDYAGSSFAAPRAVTSSIQVLSSLESAIEKRDRSKLQLTPQREGILRGGKTARFKNPFISTANKANTQISVSAIPSIQAFPVSEGKGNGIDMMAQTRHVFNKQHSKIRRLLNH